MRIPRLTSNDWRQQPRAAPTGTPAVHAAWLRAHTSTCCRTPLPQRYSAAIDHGRPCQHGATMSRTLAITLGSFVIGTGSAAQQPRLELTPCTPPGIDASAKAKCGTFTVYENRATRRGRTIGLRVVVFPATGPNRAPDPVFFIAGGPGSSIVADEGPYIALDSVGLRAHRDLVLVDQRGTGGSHPINCVFYGPPDSLQSFL